MKQITSKSLSTADNYKLLSGLIVPRTVAWVSSLNENQSVNLAPFSFFSSVPSSRPLVTLGIGNKNGSEPKDTVRNILREQEAVVHIPSEKDLKALNDSAATTPYGVSEVSAQNLTTVPSQIINTPAIDGPNIRLETKLYKAIPVENSSGTVDATVLLMEIVNYIFDETIVNPNNYHTNIKALHPIVRLAGPNYGRINDIYTLERPDHDSQPS